MFLSQILPIVKENTKPAILSALISSNNAAWSQFKRYHLKTNMQLANVSTLHAQGECITASTHAQLNYASMLMSVSCNKDSTLCPIVKEDNEDVTIIGLPTLQYFTEAYKTDVISWIYPNNTIDLKATILCCTNESMINGIQLHNPSIQMRVYC